MSGTGRKKCWGWQKERRVFPSPFFLGELVRCQHQCTLLYGWAGTECAGHAWCNVALSLPPFFFFFYPAKLMIMMMTMRKRRRRKNGTLRTWLGCSWYRFVQRRNEIAVCGYHAFSSRLPCRCCNRPDSRRQISPTSFEKHNFCKEKKKRCKFNPSGSFNLSSQEFNKPQWKPDIKTESHLTKFPWTGSHISSRVPLIHLVKSCTNSCHLA